MLNSTAAPTGLFTDDCQVTRCVWCRATLPYQQYHDQEWGMPVSDNRQLFEKICLEGFQAGLSWLTILNKREAFRLAFADFDIDEVAAFDDSDVKRLLLDAGIVRHLWQDCFEHQQCQTGEGNARRVRHAGDIFLAI